ncbi:ankyrin repeat domain-containing protein [Legionella brunensis]|uniref:ankyrin repeat domain-containing protein n=1 Tax=Legionella brunensis TaxID=29422 RepID=UPI00138F6C8B|nr:ankyrin repeat domain-containing protein [Legionella brunensis]
MRKKDEDGNTILHLACKFGYKTLVDFLIENSKKIVIESSKRRNNEGKIPVHLYEISQEYVNPDYTIKHDRTLSLLIELAKLPFSKETEAELPPSGNSPPAIFSFAGMLLAWLNSLSFLIPNKLALVVNEVFYLRIFKPSNEGKKTDIRSMAIEFLDRINSFAFLIPNKVAKINDEDLNLELANSRGKIDKALRDFNLFLSEQHIYIDQHMHDVCTKIIISFIAKQLKVAHCGELCSVLMDMIFENSDATKVTFCKVEPGNHVFLKAEFLIDNSLQFIYIDPWNNHYFFDANKKNVIDAISFYSVNNKATFYSRSFSPNIISPFNPKIQRVTESLTITPDEYRFAKILVSDFTFGKNLIEDDPEQESYSTPGFSHD